jgi:hypothetical protein
LITFIFKKQKSLLLIKSALTPLNASGVDAKLVRDSQKENFVVK